MRSESAAVRRRSASSNSCRPSPSLLHRLAAGPRARRAFGGIVLVLTAALGGCAQESSVQAPTSFSKEYFPESVYGPASERVVTNGPIPRGGGQYLVGRPYTVAGRLYVPRVMTPSFTEVGMASWYGDAFHGRRTANGEIYDKNALSAAHPTMPLPSYARVTNLSNGHSIIVRVNDRGPYHPGRVMDVSSRVADLLDFKRFGMARVRVDYVGPAGLNGSDDAELLASLRTDGEPAQMVASADRGGVFSRLVPNIPIRGLISKARMVVSRAEPKVLRKEDREKTQSLAPGEPSARRNPPVPPSRDLALSEPVSPTPPPSRVRRSARSQSADKDGAQIQGTEPPSDPPTPPARRRTASSKPKLRPGEDDED